MPEQQPAGGQAAVSGFDPCEYYAKPKRKKTGKLDGEAPKQPVFNKLIELCQVRDRSTLELSQRLQKCGYGQEEIQAAIKRAQDCGLVDDLRFADAFVRGKVSAGKGPRAIEQDLAKHGIDASCLKDWPEGYGLGSEDQLEAALRILRQHPPRSKNPFASAYRKLLQKGYPSQISYQAATIFCDGAKD